MNDIAVITTFPNNSWEIYAKKMIQSFVANWPQEIPLLIQLDDDLLVRDVQKLLRPQDAIAVGWEDDHKAFVERNKGKDDPQDYRKQAVRFCHKVFAIRRALKAIEDAKANNEPTARYLIWVDADVITQRKVTLDEVRECLPKEGDAIAYLGRKDWPHSECGWLAFDLENGGDLAIANMFNTYVSEEIFKHTQTHDSWIWDRLREIQENSGMKWTNLTADKPGMDIWPHSPMGKWSTHYKGPQAKADLVNLGQPRQLNQNGMQSNIIIQTQNAIPNEEIRKNIETNQTLINHWIRPCKPTDEEIVVVSAGPMLIAEDVRRERGKRIVAVKHALEPLKAAGIKPWACILLDPRDHVAKFVDNPDKDVIWIVASQVQPEVTRKLIDAGCTVWGYHAAVAAGEQELTKKQQYAVISGGSATATRGLYVLKHLGFKNMVLYGYDLCFADRQDLNARDERGQPKYLEMSIGLQHPLYSIKRCFWSEPQLIAQFEELNDIIKNNIFNLRAYGDGIIPFVLKAKQTGELRESELRTKINGKRLPTYEQLLKCSSKKKMLSSMMRQLKWLLSPLKTIRNSN
jgi:hypothetical protein